MKASDAQKEQMRKYYQDHRESIKERNKKYSDTHRNLPEVKAQRKAYWDKYYVLNKAEINERVSDIQKRLRKEVFSAYGNVCSCFGEDEFVFLSLDHVLGDGALDKRTSGRRGHSLLLKIKALGYPDTYRILCHNCNLGRYLNGGVCPHEAARICEFSLVA